MELTRAEESLLLAAWSRGGSLDDSRWTSNSDQVVTLSLFYTGEISAEDCQERFSVRRYMQKLYEHGELSEQIAIRYRQLIEPFRKHPELIEGGGNLEIPADPTYTACRLTTAGLERACLLKATFPTKPEFPNWPDKHSFP